MKVLYISSPAFADCDFPLIREYQRNSVDVTYLILLPCYSLRSTLFDIKKQIPCTSIFLAKEYPELSVFKSYMDMSKVYVSNRINKKRYSLSYIKETILLWKFIKTGHYDIIHSCIFFTGIRKLYYNLSDSWITTFHDPFPHLGEENGNYRKRYKDTIRGSNGFVVLNSTQKKKFCEEYKIASNRVLVNSLGYYDNIRSFIKENNCIMPNNVLFFGRISPYKGIETLCKAMAIVIQKIPNASLTIAGGGRLYFDFSPYKLLNYIELRNHYIGMEELAYLLSRCSFCVCPYSQATQSGVVMTCFGMGKPVVATNVGGLSEFILDGKNGILVPPENPQSLANAIIMLLNNREKLERMSNYIKNQEHQGDKSWDIIATKYIDYYNVILRDRLK